MRHEIERILWHISSLTYGNFMQGIRTGGGVVKQTEGHKLER